MVKRPKSPTIDDGARYMVVWNPYPSNPNWQDPDSPARQQFLWWIASIMGDHKDILAFHHKPTARSTVILEIDKSAEHDMLLGEHRWSEVLVAPSKEDKERVSRIYYCIYPTTREAQKDGWHRENVGPYDFEDWDPRITFKHPYPQTHWCEPLREDVTNKNIARPLPKAMMPETAKPAKPPVPGSAQWHVAQQQKSEPTPQQLRTTWTMHRGRGGGILNAATRDTTQPAASSSTTISLTSRGRGRGRGRPANVQVSGPPRTSNPWMRDPASAPTPPPPAPIPTSAPATTKAGSPWGKDNAMVKAPPSITSAIGHTHRPAARGPQQTPPGSTPISRTSSPWATVNPAVKTGPTSAKPTPPSSMTNQPNAPPGSTRTGGARTPQFNATPTPPSSSTPLSWADDWESSQPQLRASTSAPVPEYRPLSSDEDSDDLGEFAYMNLVGQRATASPMSNGQNTPPGQADDVSESKGNEGSEVTNLWAGYVPEHRAAVTDVPLCSVHGRMCKKGICDERKKLERAAERAKEEEERRKREEEKKKQRAQKKKERQERKKLEKEMAKSQSEVGTSTTVTSAATSTVADSEEDSSSEDEDEFKPTTPTWRNGNRAAKNTYRGRRQARGKGTPAKNGG